MRRSLTPASAYAAQSIEYLLPTADEMQIGRVRQAFVCKDPSIRWKRLVTSRSRLRKRECSAVVLGHTDPDECHNARACTPGGGCTRV